LFFSLIFNVGHIYFASHLIIINSEIIDLIKANVNFIIYWIEKTFPLFLPIHGLVFLSFLLTIPAFFSLIITINLSFFWILIKGIQFCFTATSFYLIICCLLIIIIWSLYKYINGHYFRKWGAAFNIENYVTKYWLRKIVQQSNIIHV